jgi:hypothetical protein
MDVVIVDADVDGVANAWWAATIGTNDDSLGSVRSFDGTVDVSIHTENFNELDSNSNAFAEVQVFWTETDPDFAETFCLCIRNNVCWHWKSCATEANATIRNVCEDNVHGW